jgi:hypothetical protein
MPNYRTGSPKQYLLGQGVFQSLSSKLQSLIEELPEDKSALLAALIAMAEQSINTTANDTATRVVQRTDTSLPSASTNVVRFKLPAAPALEVGSVDALKQAFATAFGPLIRQPTFGADAPSVMINWMDRNGDE